MHVDRTKVGMHNLRVWLCIQALNSKGLTRKRKKTFAGKLVSGERHIATDALLGQCRNVNKQGDSKKSFKE